MQELTFIWLQIIMALMANTVIFCALSSSALGQACRSCERFCSCHFIREQDRRQFAQNTQVKQRQVPRRA